MKVVRPFGGIQGQVPSLGSVRAGVTGVIQYICPREGIESLWRGSGWPQPASQLICFPLADSADLLDTLPPAHIYP